MKFNVNDKVRVKLVATNVEHGFIDFALNQTKSYVVPYG